MRRGRCFWNTCRRYDRSGSFSVGNDENENDDNFRDEEEEAYRLLTSMLKLLHILINRQGQQYKQATVVIHFELKCQ